jgi:2,3-dihydroxybenzoate decarboxylase
MAGKIAIEEHCVLPSMKDQMPATPFWFDEYARDVRERMAETGDARLRDMDDAGIERMVLSLGGVGVQDELDVARAVQRARASNDALAAIVAAHPDRYSAFATLPMQDPEAAAAELERAVGEHGFKGALVNGYTSVGSYDTPAFYDEPGFLPFWRRLEALDVPFYLHPRNPLPNQQRVYEGRRELIGAAWSFAVDTGTHALRLITSGLFDRCPRATVIIGHMGELLPFAIGRVEARIRHARAVTLERPLSHYLRTNFYATTSGNFHTPSLKTTLEQMGSDRVMFAVDYPFERLEDGARWLDGAPIDEADRAKIARTNAERLLRI